MLLFLAGLARSPKSRLYVVMDCLLSGVSSRPGSSAKVSASTTMAAVSEGVFRFAILFSKIVSRLSPGSHPQRTKRHGSGNHPQSTPFLVREKPLRCASDRRASTRLLNTLLPVPVTSPRYLLRHAISSTPRRCSASSTKGPPSHSGWLSTTSR